MNVMRHAHKVHIIIIIDKNKDLSDTKMNISNLIFLRDKNKDHQGQEGV